MSRKRVVVAGLGDSGILTAIRLAAHADVVGISAKPGLVSGQELGLRLSRPDDWARDYVIGFDRFRGLDRVRTVHGTLTGVDPVARHVFLERDDGTSATQAVENMQPFVHFSRKSRVEGALRAWTSERLERAMGQLADALLETRRQPALAEAIAQRTLLALAVNARRKA